VSRGVISDIELRFGLSCAKTLYNLGMNEGVYFFS